MDSEIGAKVNDNSKPVTENVDNKLSDGVEVEGIVRMVESVPVGSIALIPSTATKGRGLRKWRRRHRESGRESNSNIDSNRKRGMVALPGGMKQSEGSSSSTNAMSNVIGNALDHIALYGDLSPRKGVDFASRADSDNSEDRNSRSSTAASVPRVNHEVPVLGVGFNLIGKSSGGLMQGSDQQEKGRTATKKARGVRIKKENSISSMESDSRSSNFVFLQAANSMTSNGRPNGTSGNYDEDDSDDARNGDTSNYASHTTFSKNEADYENVSHENSAGKNPWEAKDNKVDDGVGSGDPDALVESIIPLHLAQEALEKEVQKLRDVGKEDVASCDANLQSKLEEALSMLELKNTKIAELESILDSSKIKTEYDDLLTKRIAAEMEYLVLSKTIQNLKSGPIDLTVAQKNVSATETVIATVPGQEHEDAKKLKSRVWRYAGCFIMQLILLVVVLCLFVLKYSSKSVEVIPT